MNPQELLNHLLTGPPNPAEYAGMKFLAVDSLGRVVEVPAAYMASDPLEDQDSEYLYDDDVTTIEYLFT